jgi:hypothetical protein
VPNKKEALFVRAQALSYPGIPVVYRVLADLLKHILACSTNWTNPVIRQFFERVFPARCRFPDPLSGVVFIATNCAFIDIHAVPPFLFFDISGSRRRSAPLLTW